MKLMDQTVKIGVLVKIAQKPLPFTQAGSDYTAPLTIATVDDVADTDGGDHRSYSATRSSDS